MDEKKVLSQISNLQPCFPILSYDCDFCDGSNVIYPESVHTQGCIELDECVGPPLCPKLVDVICPYCEDGKVNYDFCYIRVIMQYTADPSIDKVIGQGKAWSRYERRYREHHNKLMEGYLPTYLHPECTRKGTTFNFSTLAWTLEESFVIIDLLLSEIGFPLHLIETKKLIHIRQIPGIINNKTKSKYHAPEIGNKYLERQAKVREDYALRNSEAQSLP